MKCPYRIIKSVNWAAGAMGSDGGPVEAEEFAECYGAECPFYFPEEKIGSIKIPETCRRANNELNDLLEQLELKKRMRDRRAKNGIQTEDRHR